MALSETDSIPIPPITPGVARALSPLMRRVSTLSPEGEPGVNTYLIGIDEIAVVNPGPQEDDHLDILQGCGGDRIKWIVLTNTDAPYSAGAIKLKEMTGATIIAPESFSKADEILNEGFHIDATEFRLTAINEDDGDFSFVLEQERTLLGDTKIQMEPPKKLVDKLKPYRIRSLAPTQGQFVEDVRDVLVN